MAAPTYSDIRKKLQYTPYKLAIFRKLAPRKITREAFIQEFGEALTVVQIAEAMEVQAVTEQVEKITKELNDLISRSAYVEYKQYCRCFYG